MARRLKDNPTPAFQDTIGWIELRKGNAETALRSLKPAAAQLTSDATVQLHLGLAYDALGKIEEAKAQIKLALDLAGADTAAVFQQGRDALARLNAPAKANP